MRTLELLVPGLAQELPDLTRDLRRVAPCLYRLSCRARKYSHPRCGWDEWLCQRFGVERNDDWPVAPFTLLGDGGEPGSEFWLRADPVHLVADRATVRLVGAPIPHLSKVQADALGHDLNVHFASEGIHLWVPHPERWYVKTTAPARMSSVSPAEAAGRSIDALLPTGPDAASWMRRTNEAQMLLHEHPINLEREARGGAPANSVWFWGSGRLSHPNTRLAGVWSNWPLARGLAIATHSSLHPTPSSADALLAAPAGVHLVCVAERSNDSAADGAQHRLDELEHSWFAPLYGALRNGALDKLSWTTTTAQAALSFDIERADLWKLWRRSASLPESNTARAESDA